MFTLQRMEIEINQLLFAIKLLYKCVVYDNEYIYINYEKTITYLN